jgi:hypothetical protein
MKKTIISLAVALSIGLTSFAEGGKNIVGQTQDSFKKEFADARDVSWHTQHDFRVAEFSLNGRIMNAYYNDHAELVAVVQNILSDRLPIYLYTDLKRNYNAFWISNLSEVATQGESNYYITLENADQVVVLKSYNATEWVIKKKMNKTEI